MEVSGQLHASAAISPEKETMVPIGWEVGWAPEPGWILRSRVKSVSPAGNPNAAFQPVAIPTELSRLHIILLLEEQNQLE
jgi:hypothetical protein